MPDAVAEAKRLLGDEASILHSAQYESPGWLGLFKRHGVEILVAAGASGADGKAASAGRTPSAVEDIERRLGEIRRVFVERMSCPRVDRSQVVERLVRQGVSESVAETVAGDCGENPDSALDAIARRIKCAGPIECGAEQVRIALVGPTGVGKTTTAAKLAAHYSLIEKRSVVLMTLDTHSIGAVEQLAAYAGILDVPFEAAFGPEDAENLMAKHSDKNLVIIDTSGHSQRNGRDIEDLGRFLHGLQPTEVHLVVSASASQAAQHEAAGSFGRTLGVGRLLVTKLDECPQPGCILELAVRTLLPMSYVTCGRDVPENFERAESKSLAGFVWAGTL